MMPPQREELMKVRSIGLGGSGGQRPSDLPFIPVPFVTLRRQRVGSPGGSHPTLPRCFASVTNR